MMLKMKNRIGKEIRKNLSILKTKFRRFQQSQKWLMSNGLGEGGGILSNVGGVHNHDLQNYKWKSLWLYMRLLAVKRFF